MTHIIVVAHRSSTVGDVLAKLRRAHKIPSLSHIRPNVYYDQWQRSPLTDQAVLGDLGIRELSMLYIRYSVRGGSHIVREDSGESHRRILILDAHVHILLAQTGSSRPSNSSERGMCLDKPILRYY